MNIVHGMARPITLTCLQLLPEDYDEIQAVIPPEIGLTRADTGVWTMVNKLYNDYPLGQANDGDWITMPRPSSAAIEFHDPADFESIGYQTIPEANMLYTVHSA